MNVAASSIASAQPSAIPTLPGAQTAPDEGSSGSFAEAMVAVQPKDGTQTSSSVAQPKSTPTAADTPAAPPNAPKLAIAAASPVKPFAPSRSASPQATNGKDDVNEASGEASLSSDAKDVLSSVKAQDGSIGSAQVPSAPLQTSTAVLASPTASDTAEGAAKIVDAAPSAPAADDLLSHKHLDGKTSAAGTIKSAKKTEHVHEASADKAATSQLPHIASAPTPWKVGEVNAAASAPQPQPAENDVEPAPDTASILAALKPAAMASPSPHAVAAAKDSGVTVQNGESAPAAQPIVVTPAATQPASVHGAAAVENAAARQAAPMDEHGDTSIAGNVFAEALAPSAVTSQPAAMFVPSLTTEASPAGEHRSSTDVVTSPPTKDSTPDGTMVQAAPVRRLEIAVNDPVLGNMDVRAEMRGGALHATLIGTQDSAAASMPALHQFLQQHDVSVHTLTYATVSLGVAATASTTSSSSDMSGDTAGRNFSGGAGTGSQQPQRDGSQPQGQQRYGTSASEYDEHLFVPGYSRRSPGTPAAINTLPTGSTLSIHI